MNKSPFSLATVAIRLFHHHSPPPRYHYHHSDYGHLH